MQIPVSSQIVWAGGRGAAPHSGRWRPTSVGQSQPLAASGTLISPRKAADGRLVQYIENSVIGVRAALYTLARKIGAPRFLLFPMVHIGSPEYYSHVHKSLETSDVVLFEGVRTFRARVLSLSYRFVARRKRLGLVTQGASLLRGLRGRLIHADVAPGEFSNNWARIPWHFRLMILLIAPAYGAYRYLTATKESLGRHMESEDVESSGQSIGGDTPPAFDKVIFGSRDAKLVAALKSVVDSANPPATVGIVYGAAHMKVVTAVLMDLYHYQVESAEWVAVFDYDST